jgi:hypothetical protein
MVNELVGNFWDVHRERPKRAADRKDAMFYQIFAYLAAMLVLGNPAFAQGANCGDHARIVDQLQTRFGESRRNLGLNQNNSIVEVFASDETGTWTILVTQPSGVACLVAAGENWQEVAGEVVPEGAPA